MFCGLIVLIAAGLATVSALPPCVCTRNYQPVCGSDGQTYDNECMLACAQTKNSELHRLHYGRCPDDQDSCICTMEYKPVCGSDGQTYPNRCALNCHRSVRFISHGSCPEKPVQKRDTPPCVCTREAKPVCGSNGVTYSNPCILNCATSSNPRLSIKNYGPCVDEVNVVDQPEQEENANICACTRNMQPVCGNDGNTYSNPCMLNCATAKKPRLAIKHYGACIDEVKVVDQPGQAEYGQMCACTRNMQPVCGTDGNTYSNPCMLHCATAKNPALAIKNYGACADKVQVAELKDIPCACTRNMRPVCGSDGKTYNNPCLLNCATKYNPSLSIARQGRCEDVNGGSNPGPAGGCTCTRELAPVCGSDGETYSSACIMRCRNPGAELVHDGPCEV